MSHSEVISTIDALKKHLILRNPSPGTDGMKLYADSALTPNDMNAEYLVEHRFMHLGNIRMRQSSIYQSLLRNLVETIECYASMHQKNVHKM